MRTHTLLALICLSWLTPALFGQTNTPPIPEEARKHFVMGTTLFKDAKTADDFSQVTSEFKQATDLAPQWPEARYNLALAKEAAGDYSGAMADLKLYQQFQLSDTEARKVQDKIYTLEAKEQKIKTAANEHASAAEQARRDFLRKIEGDWYDTGWHLNIRRFNDSVSIRMDARGDDAIAGYHGDSSRQSFPDPGYNVLVSGNSLKFSIRNRYTNGKEKIRNFDLKLLEDGHIRLEDKVNSSFWRAVGGRIDW